MAGVVIHSGVTGLPEGKLYVMHNAFVHVGFIFSPFQYETCFEF